MPYVCVRARSVPGTTPEQPFFRIAFCWIFAGKTGGNSSETIETHLIAATNSTSMKIQVSGVAATTLSGKYSGAVFNKNNTVRVKRTPRNPQTSGQIEQRASLTTFAQAWASLTASQRTAWETAAKSGDWKGTDRLGDSFNPSGSGLFSRLNLNLNTIGVSQISDVPVKVSAPALTLGAVTCTDAPAFTLAYTGTLGSGHKLVISATGQQSAGRMQSPKSGFRIVLTSTSTSPVNIASAYTTLFGDLVEGKKIFIKVELISNTSGQRSLVGTTSVIVAAA